MKARLIPLDGSAPLEISKDVTLIGRRRLCDIKLDHPSISKVHIVVVKTDGVLFFRDLASTNGTKVNGQRVCRGALLPNDQLSIAACKFTVRLGSNGEAATNDNGHSQAGKPTTERDPNNDNEIAGHPVRKVIRPAEEKMPRPKIKEVDVEDDAMLETDREPEPTPSPNDSDPKHLDDSGVLPMI